MYLRENASDLLEEALLEVSLHGRLDRRLEVLDSDRLLAVEPHADHLLQGTEHFQKKSRRTRNMIIEINNK